jgi:putative ABC transport system permease protein
VAMSVWRLIVREILYRKLSFGLAVLAVLVAVGSLVAVRTVLERHDAETQHIVAQKEEETGREVERRKAETRDRMRQLEDDTRKIMLKLGFNVLILPRDQNVSDLYAQDYASKYMPEEYVQRLAQSKIATINHLLPSLQQKVFWEERQRLIILIGTRGEVPILHADPKKPLLDAVPPGTMVVGHELHRSLNLKKGDRVVLQGRDFTVHKLQPARGNADDITIWINLAEAQEMLDKKGLINGILALECNCEADRLDKIRAEIQAILPDTQVIEKASEALTRAEARNRAAKEAQETLVLAVAAARADVDREKLGRAQLRREQEAFAAWLLPLVTVGCVVWIGLLTLGNVRDRAVEIGILRALGLRRRQVFTLFMGKAVLVGLLGAVLGWCAGTLVGTVAGERPDTALAWVYDPVLLAAVLGAAPILCGLASWMPALLAARQDPAIILREA